MDYWPQYYLVDLTLGHTLSGGAWLCDLRYTGSLDCRPNSYKARYGYDTPTITINAAVNSLSTN